MEQQQQEEDGRHGGDQGGVGVGNDDGRPTSGGVGGVSIGRRFSTSSVVPLPTALSNAHDLRPGSFPDGHPMSRVRSSTDLNQIAWLTAKVKD